MNSSSSSPGNRRQLPLHRRNRSYLIFLLVLASYGVLYPATGQPLSPSAQISLITVSPGKELYSGFGHSAFWVSDPATGIDRVYNYGTFDFRTENFYIKFIRGKLPYMLSVAPMHHTLYGAQLEDRSVFQDELNLTQKQKQRLYDLLEVNLQPENRYYKYDFLYDNCSTRLRDILKKACGDSLLFSELGGTQTFRDWIQYYMNVNPFIQTGMDLVLGLPTDQRTGAYNEMFLPDNLRAAFRRATLRSSTQRFGSSPDEKPLVNRDTTLFKAVQPLTFEPQHTILILSGTLFLIGLLLTYYQLKWSKITFWFDRVLFFFAGLMGCLLAFLWLGTDHYVTRDNWNILWAIPFHTIVVFLLQPRAASWVKIYFTVTLLLAMGILLLGGLFIQEFSLPFMPIVALLALRAWHIQRQLSTFYARS